MALYWLVVAMVFSAIVPNVLAVGYKNTYQMVKIGFGIAWALVVSVGVCLWIYGALVFHMMSNTVYIGALVLAVLFNGASVGWAADSSFERPAITPPTPPDDEAAG